MNKLAHVGAGRRPRAFGLTPSRLVRCGGVALLIALAGCGKEPAPPRAKASALVVDISKVEPRPFRETLTATGSLVAREFVSLQAETAGLVVETRFEEGKPVKSGEVLVVMDDTELRAQLARAEAQLALSTATEKRQRDLFGTRAISEAEYDASKANLGIARAETELVRAQLAKRKIVAPFDGVIGLRQVSVGTYVTPGAPIATFQDIGALKVDFSVPERYLGLIQPGQKVRFRIAGRADAFEAEIAAIEPSIEVATRSLRIRAIADNAGQRLLPGSFAEIEVSLGEVPDAILIPPIALVPGLKQQTVFVHRDGKAEERKVQPGLRTNAAVQIVEGLRAGDEVITSGILQLRNGMAVQVNKQPRNAQPAPAQAAAADSGSSPQKGADT